MLLGRPNVAGHLLDLHSPGDGHLRFSIREEPGMAYSFVSSTDHPTWQRFGFLQLGDDGEESFGLTQSAATAFLSMAADLSK